MRKKLLVLLFSCLVLSACDHNKVDDVTDEFEESFDDSERDVNPEPPPKPDVSVDIKKDYPSDYKKSIDKLSFRYNIPCNCSVNGYEYSHTNTDDYNLLHVFYTHDDVLVELKQGLISQKKAVTNSIEYKHIYHDDSDIVVKGWAKDNCQFAYWCDNNYYFSVDFGDGVDLDYVRDFVKEISKSLG